MISLSKTRANQLKFMQEKMSAEETKAENQSIEMIVAFEKNLKQKYKEIEKKRKDGQDVNYSSYEG